MCSTATAKERKRVLSNTLFRLPREPARLRKDTGRHREARLRLYFSVSVCRPRHAPCRDVQAEPLEQQHPPIDT